MPGIRYKLSPDEPIRDNSVLHLKPRKAPNFLNFRVRELRARQYTCFFPDVKPCHSAITY
jgi:hypothetical protein